MNRRSIPPSFNTPNRATFPSGKNGRPLASIGVASWSVRGRSSSPRSLHKYIPRRGRIFGSCLKSRLGVKRHPQLVHRDLPRCGLFAERSFGVAHAIFLAFATRAAESIGGQVDEPAAVPLCYDSTLVSTPVSGACRGWSAPASSVLRGVISASARHHLHACASAFPRRSGPGASRRTPPEACASCAHGHELIVEAAQARASAWTTTRIVNAGATIVATAARGVLRGRRNDRQGQGAAGGQSARCFGAGQMLFTYLHLAPDPEQAPDLIASGAVCIAYETVTSADRRAAAARADVGGRRAHGDAGRRAIILEKAHGGLGMLARRRARCAIPRKVVILGGGVVGSHACPHRARHGRGSWVLDRSADVLRALWRQFGRPLNTVFSTHDAIEHHVTSADLRRRRRADPGRVGAEARVGRADRSR